MDRVKLYGMFAAKVIGFTSLFDVTLQSCNRPIHQLSHKLYAAIQLFQLRETILNTITETTVCGLQLSDEAISDKSNIRQSSYDLLLNGTTTTSEH